MLHRAKEDLDNSGIEGVLSDDIRRDVLRKFAFTSAYASVSAYYYDHEASELQKDGEYRSMMIELLEEIQTLANKADIQLIRDLV
ncbi:ketopantoate reductase [Paenibacillus brasilensis]|uniref:Ketopantoate reductase n=1 Tax=Paenibacillus brasilensis TaxID=128574 RepID=A0ABU0L641_9BACL|nr:ketopantoate reductase [Paenibacillus brasilensis]